MIARLTARNHHLLSLRLSSYINLRPDPVLKHWARAKIARARPLGAGAGAAADDEICEAIVSKFEKQPAVSYGEIASTAWKAGRVRLATKVSFVSLYKQLKSARLWNVARHLRFHRLSYGQ